MFDYIGRLQEMWPVRNAGGKKGMGPSLSSEQKHVLLQSYKCSNTDWKNV
jgi:hypothetical protein